MISESLKLEVSRAEVAIADATSMILSLDPGIDFTEEAFFSATFPVSNQSIST